jgi:hypothetical protein
MSASPTFIKSGYHFSMAGSAIPGAPASCNGLAAGAGSSGYALVADPLDVTAPARFFGTNADGTIWEAPASLMATMPEFGAPPGATPLK